jgi:ADP-ribose pyrophosphatase
MPVDRPVASERVFDGHVVRLDLEDWGLGYRAEVVRHLGAAAVLPITRDGHVLLVEQFRPAVRRSLVEIPAGLLDLAGEDAVTAAARELREETGFRHTSIEFLGGYYASVGFTDEYVHVFWASVAEPAEGQPEAGIRLLREPLAAMIGAARAGRVRDVKTAYALLMVGARPDVLAAAGVAGA